jgi:hypothetical protein
MADRRLAAGSSGFCSSPKCSPGSSSRNDWPATTRQGNGQIGLGGHLQSGQLGQPESD